MRGPSTGGFFGGSGRFFAPIIHQWGQSNSEGQDADFTNPRTGLAFVPTAGVVYRANNPTQYGVVAYPYAATHGLELSMGNDLAAAQGGGGKPIVQVKAAVNGTNIQNWLPSGLYYPTLVASIVAAKAASTLRQVAFICQQGEAEAQGQGLPLQYQADFTAFMLNVRALYGAEYTVRFYCVLVNPNTPAAPDLALIRADQVAACAAVGNAVVVASFDSIVPALDSGLHYGAGQTFPMGSTLAARIVADYANAGALAGIGVSADASIGAIFGSRLKYLNETWNGVTTTTIADQSGNGNNYTAVGLVVTASDATLQNTQTVEVPAAVTATGALITPTPAPGTPFSLFWIRKLKVAAAANLVVDSSGGNTDGLFEFQTGTNCVISYAGNPISPAAGNAEAVNAWQFGFNEFSHEATNIVWGGRYAVQGDAGGTAASGHVRTLNGFGAPNNADFQQAVLGYVVGAVTASELNRVRNFYAKKFAVAASPLAPAVFGL